MFDITTAQPLAVFCKECDHCPRLFVDDSAPPERRVVLADDFGSQVRMSAAQFGDIVTQAKSGALDTVV